MEHFHLWIKLPLAFCLSISPPLPQITTNTLSVFIYYFSIFSKISYKRSPPAWILLHQATPMKHSWNSPTLLCESLLHSFRLLSCIPHWADDTVPLPILVQRSSQGGITCPHWNHWPLLTGQAAGSWPKGSHSTQARCKNISGCKPIYSCRIAIGSLKREEKLTMGAESTRS